MAYTLETDPIKQVDEILECTLCQKRSNDPRTLPCCHSFCKVCLEGVVKACRNKVPRDRRPIREIPCPNCRTAFVLEPDKQVADMRQNPFICNMVQDMTVLDRGIGVPCSHNCSQSYSVARCVTCEKFLCRECLTGHNNYRANNGHSVLTMEEFLKPENQKIRRNKMYCDEHSGMILKVYCETCDQLICKDCMHFKHVKQSHSCVLVKDVANDYKDILALNNRAMKNALTEGNACLQQLTRERDRLDREAIDVKNRIAQRNEFVTKKVVEMLNQKAKTLFKKVDEIHKGKRGNLERQTEETKSYVENIKTSVQLSEKLVDQGTEEEIISSQKMMLDNANNLLRKRDKYFKAPVPVVKFDYTAVGKDGLKIIWLNTEILSGLENSLGDVSERNMDGGKSGFLLMKRYTNNIEIRLTLNYIYFSER